jgi:alpha/beta superfamily hydrolase
LTTAGIRIEHPPMPNAIPDLIRNRHGERLEFTYHPGAAELTTLVVIGHGVTGNKDRPLLIALAETLARAGIHAVRFSFAGNGGSEGRFADCTVSKEVGDLGAVLDALPGWRIGYAGHSMGAAVGVLRARTDRRIQFLISLAGMANTAEFARREFGEVKPGAGCMWDKPECPLSQAYVDDMNRIGSVVEAARQVRLPWLFVHGTNDDVVPFQDSRDLLAVATEPKRLVELPAADHVFSDPEAAAMAGAVVDWVRTLPV